MKDIVLGLLKMPKKAQWVPNSACLIAKNQRIWRQLNKNHEVPK